MTAVAEADLNLHQRYNIDLPQQTVAESLNALAQQTGAQFLFPYQLANAQAAQPVKGQLTLLQATHQLLHNTGLQSDLVDGVLTISLAGDGGYSGNQNHKGKRMNTNKRKTVLATMVGLFAAGGMSATMAQGQVGESARAQAVLDEVIVTAQKRKESMQDVGIFISTFTGDKLAESGIENTLDLQMVTPGLSISTLNNNGYITIRGVGSSTLEGPSSDPSASIYIDGVYQSRLTSFNVEMMDIERVEVLKGPQVALYGRNSLGGSIHYNSKDPSDEFGGSLSVNAGNYGLIKAKANMDIPLANDSLLLRASVMRTQRDGYTQAINNPAWEEDYEDFWGGRFTMKYIASETFDITLHASAVNDSGDFGARKIFLDPINGILSSATLINDPRKIMINVPREASKRNRLADITVRWDLGWAELKSITAYSDVDVGPLSDDIDATELDVANEGRPGVANGTVEDAQTLTQEFILASQGDDELQWVLGFSYLNEDGYYLSGIDVPIFSLPYFQTEAITKTDAYAAYGRLSYPLSEKFRINMDLRYSYETKKFFGTELEEFVVVSGPTTFPEESWNAWTPKLGLDYIVNDDVLLYASASRGFKSGGHDIKGTAVDPEFLTAFEVGAKTQWLDDRLRLNISAFKYYYKDMQVNATIIVESDEDVGALFETKILNAAESEVNGLELAVSVLPVSNFKIDMGLSWVDATYKEFIADGNVDVSGNDLPDAPDFTASLGLEYSYLLADIGEVLVSLDYYHTSEKYFDEFNLSNARMDSYDLLNARVSLDLNDHLNISVYGKNLTDELIYTNVLGGAFFYGTGFNTALRPPRTYGAEIQYRF